MSMDGVMPSSWRRGAAAVEGAGVEPWAIQPVSRCTTSRAVPVSTATSRRSCPATVMILRDGEASRPSAPGSCRARPSHAASFSAFGALAGAAGLAPSLGACVTDDLGTGAGAAREAIGARRHAGAAGRHDPQARGQPAPAPVFQQRPRPGPELRRGAPVAARPLAARQGLGRDHRRLDHRGGAEIRDPGPGPRRPSRRRPWGATC